MRILLQATILTVLFVLSVDGKACENQCPLMLCAPEGLCKFDPIKCRSVCVSSEKSCPDICPEIYDPVCGSNGKTYPNACVLERASCNIGGKITQVSEGECPKSCPEICPLIYDPVCGSDGKTYSNACFLKSASCKSGGKITQVSKGECRPCENQCPVMLCAPEALCKFDPIKCKSTCVSI